MNCDWTEKISLLIDGELPPQERRATESHLETCAACRRTKEDFLSLRSVVSSYPLAADAGAERRALENILAAGARATRGGAAAATTTTTPRPSWRELLRLPRLTPAAAAALAVLLLSVALGVVWSVGRRDAGQTLVAEGPAQDKARQSSTGPTASDTPAPKASTPDAPTSDPPASGGPSEPEKKDAPGGVNAPRRKMFDVPRAIERRDVVAARRTTRATAPSGGATDESASNAAEARRRESAADALAEFRPLFAAAGGPEGDKSALRAGTEPRGDTERHLEQAQILMRTIRNARPGDRPAIADERRRSQQLLYRNIVLRREAARTGNAPVEHALDSLEPLLIDIANLPERASREDVSVIQERMRRKNIVAVLQANIAAVPRTYQ